MHTITQDDRSGVSRLQLQGAYYVKIYSGWKELLGQIFYKSRFEAELANQYYFSELGICTPQVAAFGRELRWGICQRTAMVTREVANSTTLEELINKGDLYKNGVARTRELLKKLAQVTRLLHRNLFFHRDLKTRNILVVDTGQQYQLYFIDCPSGYHPPRFLWHKSIIRDLAYLERGFRGRIRNVDMLYFFKQYLGVDKLDADDKHLARSSLRYYGNRKMTRKRRRRALARQNISGES